ncbi:hypothetical protein J2S10_002649 [Neobacillus ginsengisoli]|uniref:Uncharacterized protein n=1 Tax=Neobacillus ginsengisoli TaxID=904295 RepID=A0ABT9XX62_9BACI|nr:hypothetical protein [Neobacillus ginsengisoli]
MHFSYYVIKMEPFYIIFSLLTGGFFALPMAAYSLKQGSILIENGENCK